MRGSKHVRGLAAIVAFLLTTHASAQTEPSNDNQNARPGAAEQFSGERADDDALRWKSIGPMPTQWPTPSYSDSTPMDAARTSGQVTAIALDPGHPEVIYLGASGGGVWKTLDGGSHWVSLFGKRENHSIGSIALDPQDPDTIYVGTGVRGYGYLVGLYGDGIEKSKDGGRTWEHLGGNVFGGPRSSDFLDGGARIGGLAVQPGNSNIVLAAVASRAFDTLPATLSGIYRSTDGGKHWGIVLSGSPGRKVFFDPTNGNVAYALFSYSFLRSNDDSNGIWKSVDGGQTWKKLTLKIPGAMTFLWHEAMAIVPSSPQTLYAFAYEWKQGNPVAHQRLFKTTDGGLSWAQVAVPSSFSVCDPQTGCGGGELVLAVDPIDPNVLFAGWTDLERSLDGGITWQPANAGIHPDHHALVFSRDGTTLYDANDGGIARTTDITGAKVSWTTLNDTLGITQFYCVSIEPTNLNRAFGGTQDNGLQAFGGSLGWNRVSGTDDGDVFAMALNVGSPNVIYAAIGDLVVDFKLHFLRVSFDGGSFDFVDTTSITDVDSVNSRFVATDPNDGRRVYVLGTMVWQSPDRGNTWQPISPSLTWDSLFSLAIAPSDSNTIYVGTWGQSGPTTGPSGLSVTRNALSGSGAIWTDVSSPALPAGRLMTSIAVDPLAPTTAYLTFTGFTFGTDTSGHVFKTIDAGATWTDVSGNLPNTPVHALVVDPARPDALYIGTDIGPFYTVNGGATWARMGAFPRVPTVDLKLHAATRTLRAATHGRGMWDLQLRLNPVDGW